MAEAKGSCLTGVVQGNEHKGMARLVSLLFFFSNERVKLCLIVKDISQFIKKTQQTKPKRPFFMAQHSHMRQQSGFRNSYGLSVAL